MSKVAAITITYNRLDLTQQTVKSFYEKTSVDYHLFVDNGSDDGTVEWLKSYDHILLGQNYGITYALTVGVNALSGYDFILKLDNDVETVTENMVSKMLDFHSKAGMNYVCSPVDLAISPNFYPTILGSTTIGGYPVQFVSHTGGAFQLMPETVCRSLCKEYRHLKKGDYMIGRYYRNRGYRPVYLTSLEMRHIGLNRTSPNYVL